MAWHVMEISSPHANLRLFLQIRSALICASVTEIKTALSTAQVPLQDNPWLLLFVRNKRVQNLGPLKQQSLQAFQTHSP